MSFLTGAGGEFMLDVRLAILRRRRRSRRLESRFTTKAGFGNMAPESKLFARGASASDLHRINESQE
jgi:hypothetical protein